MVVYASKFCVTSMLLGEKTIFYYCFVKLSNVTSSTASYRLVVRSSNLSC